MLVEIVRMQDEKNKVIHKTKMNLDKADFTFMLMFEFVESKIRCAQ